MTILSADHLLDQADGLIVGLTSGRPRQADLTRAISAAYYGVFHVCLTAAADEFVGIGRRANARYELVYRSVDHRVFRDVCEEAIKSRPRVSFLPFIPTGGLGAEIQAFSIAALELQRQRYVSDYAALGRFEAAEARQTVSAARSAIRSFAAAPEEARKMFLTLLVCPPRAGR